MIHSWKSDDLHVYRNTNERRMQELDKKLRGMVDRVMESQPVHKGVETIARNYVKLGQKMINGKVVKIIKKVA